MLSLYFEPAQTRLTLSFWQFSFDFHIKNATTTLLCIFSVTFGLKINLTSYVVYVVILVSILRVTLPEIHVWWCFYFLLQFFVCTQLLTPIISEILASESVS